MKMNESFGLEGRQTLAALFYAPNKSHSHF